MTKRVAVNIPVKAKSSSLRVGWAVRFVLLIGLVVRGAADAYAQVPPPDFVATDSITRALAQAGAWRALDSVGRAALRGRLDYPALRRRLGLAATARGRTVAAARHYGAALRADPADDSARIGLGISQLLLGLPERAHYTLRPLPDSARKSLGATARHGLRRLAADVTAQRPTSIRRGDAAYARLAYTHQLAGCLSLTLGAAWFEQNVALRDAAGTLTAFAIRQPEAYALAHWILNNRWAVRGGYHYLGVRYGASRYPSHVVTGGIAHTRPWGMVQISAHGGWVSDSTRGQLDVSATVFPGGTGRLYVFGRGSGIWSSGHFFPNTLVGTGVVARPWLWLEAFGSLGRTPVLVEAEGATVYNLLDPLGWGRAGAGVTLAPPARPLRVRLYYTAEARRAAVTGIGYSLFTLTSSLVWTW